jgi:FkbM family methyltransferase
MLDKLRNQISRSMLMMARQIATDRGWSRLSDALGAPNMRASLIRLHNRGIRPEYVLDGGACVGDWTRLFHSVFPDAKILMVEPQSRHKEKLTALTVQRPSHIKFVNTLLGPPGLNTVPFVVLDDQGGGTGSSVMPEISDVPRHIVQMPVITLDKLVVEQSFGTINFIKLDVQGYEIEVLKGASETLKHAEFVLLEVSISKYNEGSPLIYDIVQWMYTQEYIVYELFDLSRRNDVLVQIDFLFARANSKF